MSDRDHPSRSSLAVLATLKWIRDNNFRGVPVVYRSKAAATKDYVSPTYQTPDDSLWRTTQLNLGLVVGPKANGPGDGDLDCPEAIFLAPYFFPPTPGVFGRESKRRSHLLYLVDDEELPKITFMDPMRKGKDQGILELRGDGGHQTVLPGSVHESGELIEWDQEIGSRAPVLPRVSASVLIRAAQMTATAVLIARHLWNPGSRNDVSNALCGMFQRLGWSLEDTERMIQAVMDFTGDEDGRMRLITARNTYNKAERGAKTTGSTKLKEITAAPLVVDRILEWVGDPSTQFIDDYNERFAVVSLEGKMRVVNTRVRPSYPPTFSSREDFIHLNESDTLTITDDKGNPKRLEKSKLWLKDPRRQSYSGVDFMPGVDGEGTTFNLWTGWAIPPDPDAGSCTAWLELLRSIICGDDPGLFEWCLHWFAGILRDPMDKAGTALVLVGEFAAGKSLLLGYFGQILGGAYTVVTDAEQIYGKHNKHLATTLLLHSEEAVYGGEQKHRSVIKSLITDEFQMYEPKNIDAKQIRSFVRVALASNELQAAPVEPGDRRFTVIDLGQRKVSEALKDRVVAEKKAGGPSALHHFLRAMPYDPKIPRTNVKNESLINMKSGGLDPIDGWWFETLQNGTLLPDYLHWASLKVDDWPADWPSTFSKQALHYAYNAWAREHSRRTANTGPEAFAMKLKKMLRCDHLRSRSKVSYGNPYQGDTSGDVPPNVRQMNSKQNSYDQFPSLAECRESFSQYIGQPITWPDPPEPIPPRQPRSKNHAT